MKKINFSITKEYYDRNFDKIKQELQSYVDAMIEFCGQNSEEHMEAVKIQNNILNGDFEELEGYLAQMYYSVNGEPEKYCPTCTILIDLIDQLPKIERVK